LLIALLLASGPPPTATGQSYSLAESIFFFQPGYLFPWTAEFRGSTEDWDNDGILDFAVFYPGGLASQFSRLRIHSGFDYSILEDWVGSVPPTGIGSDQFGMGADFADMDLDGHPDAVISTPGAYLGPLSQVGRVDVVSSVTGTSIYSVWGEALGDAFGYRLSGVGDTSGDGTPDFVVFAPGADGPGGTPNVGALYLIEGADGSVRYKYYGLFERLSGLGDLDGDGLADFAASRPLVDPNLVGRVTVYSGYSPPSIIREHIGTQAGGGLGTGALFSLDDSDGDLVPDYVISAWTWGGGTPLSPGQAWLHSGATGLLIQTYGGPLTSAGFGNWGDRLDDLDGDGVDDLVLQAATGPLPSPLPGWPGAGQLVVLSALTANILQVIDHPFGSLGSPSTGYPTGFGYRVQTSGDIDGDGRLDFCAGQAPLFVYTHDIVTVTPNPVPLGTTATFDFSLPAQPGALFHLLFSPSAITGIPLGTRTFPLDFHPLLVSSLENPAFGGFLDPSGAASIAIPVPMDPSLSGLTLKFAGVSFSPTAPYFVKTIGSAMTVTVQ
jgi:hypothetical protein